MSKWTTHTNPDTATSGVSCTIPNCGWCDTAGSVATGSALFVVDGTGAGVLKPSASWPRDGADQTVVE